MIKLGISSATYAWAVGFPEVMPNHPLTAMRLLEKAQELGVGLFQFGPNLPLDRLAQTELQDVVKHAKSWNIDLEMASRGLDPEHLRSQIAFAKRYGVILLETTPEMQDRKIPFRREIVDCLLAVHDDLEKGKVLLAIDNGRVPAAMLNEVLGCISRPWLGVALDTVTPLRMSQGWTLSVRLLAHRTLSVHIKDFCVEPAHYGMGFTVEGRPVGNGQLDIPWMVKSFAALRVEPSFILESWTPQQNTVQETMALEHQWAKQGVKYLRRFISD
jgi:sugar phosphate isomerase/epimerase